MSIKTAVRAMVGALLFFATASAVATPTASAQFIDPDDVVAVYCDYNLAPPYVVVVLAHGPTYSFPLPVYADLQGPLGLPPIVCDYS